MFRCMGEVDTRDAAAVAAANALCPRPEHRLEWHPVRAALYRLEGLSFEAGCYTDDRGPVATIRPPILSL
jgi:hypothetical protein